VNNYICHKCGGLLGYRTTFVGGLDMPYTENEMYCDRCGIHLKGDAVPREKTEDELERLYQELNNNN
jgi:hypothetical protein